jgi:MerR family mercuric resistance operon transcriptional regulator
MITKMRGITTGALASAAGVNLETVRYYERIGLMPRPPRTEGGHRAYESGHVRRLSFIRRARELGFSIDEVRALLALANPEHRSCAEAKSIASVHLTDVRAKLADMAKLEGLLTAAISRCTGEPTVACPVLDMLDVQ